MSQPARPSLEAVVDDVAHRCRAGLGAAAGALYGRDATATARALRAQAEGQARRWPWLPGPCYAGLEPLGVAFSQDDRPMVVAGKALVGRPVRPERVAEAARQLCHPEPVAPPQAPDPALAAAVDRFWARLNGLARRLGQAVRAGDADAVDQLLQRGRDQLADSAAAVREAAEAAVAGSGSVAAPGPVAGSSVGAGSAPLSAPARPEPAPADPAPAEPSPASPTEPPPETVEDEGALGPDRPYAPVIFVGLSLLVALVLLLVTGLGALGS